MAYEGNCRLGDLFKSQREKGHAGLPLLSVTMNDGLVNRDHIERKQDTSLGPEDHLLVKPGDIAYNMMRMWQGAFGLSDQVGLVSPAYVVLRPKKTIDSKYAAYLFKTPRLLYLFRAYSYGLTDDRLRLYPKDFSRIPVNVPPKHVQSRIATQLGYWERAIDVIDGLIRTTEAQRKLLTRRLMLPIDRLPGFSGAWDDAAVKDLGNIVSGGTPETDNGSFWNGDIPWAIPSDISSLPGRYIYNTERRLTAAGLAACSAKVVPPGTLLICTRATICELAISMVPIATNQGFKSLIPTSSYSPDFLYHLFRFHKKEFVRRACGSTFLELSKRDFERMRFSIPGLDEQLAIAAVLNNLGDQVAALKEQRVQINLEQRGLLQMLGSPG